MIGDRKVLAVIPARGGSTGVKDKNIRSLADKPLIAWTIEEASRSKYIDRIILSSDSEAIMQVATEYGCEVPFKRPEHLARDETPGIAPVLHALENIPDYNDVILLQPTSPLRKVSDIDSCLEFYAKSDKPACVSVCPPSKSPFWCYTLDDELCMRPLIEREQISNRQSLPPAYAVNGAIYIADISWLKVNKRFISQDTQGFEMSVENSIDIDTELDFEICECLLKRRNLVS